MPVRTPLLGNWCLGCEHGSFIYLAALIFLISLTAIQVTNRPLIDATLLRGSGNAERIIDEQGNIFVRKHFEISLVNKTLQPMPVTMSLPDQQAGHIIGPMVDGVVPVGKAVHTGIYVELPASAFSERQLETTLQVAYSYRDTIAQETLMITLPRPKIPEKIAKVATQSN